MLQTISPAIAQNQIAGWGTPVNLSYSGAADQPQIVASPNGTLQVFWWDRFDGLMSAIYDGSNWSAPIETPLPSNLNLRPPRIVADNFGWVHAFWNEANFGSPLYHSQMQIGSSKWATPDLVAESGPIFKTTSPAGGGLMLVYTRVVDTPEAPAGIYFKQITQAGGSWSAPSIVYKSLYFRLLEKNSITFQFTAGVSGLVHLSWHDPRLAEILYTRSNDRGSTWTEVETVGNIQDLPYSPRLATLPSGSLLRLWQTGLYAGCTLYQDQLDFSISVSNTIPATPNQVAVTTTSPQQVLTSLPVCPANDFFWIVPSINQVYWMWNEGSDLLTLSSWDALNNQWASPIDLSFSFRDEATQRLVVLGDLHAAPSGDSLAVVGSDNVTGEVYATLLNGSISQLEAAPVSLWSPLQRLPTAEQPTGDATIVTDGNGRIHVVWTQFQTDSLDSILYYALSDNRGLSQPQEIYRVSSINSPGRPRIVRQPAMVVDGQNRIHLVWSGGENGEILYSRARADEAGSSGSWTVALPVSASTFANEPEIDVDLDGQLYVVYVEQVNESRGIYLVKSQSGEQEWSEPIRIFDAASQGWEKIDHPALKVDEQGVVHVAWVRSYASDTRLPSFGVYYAQSLDGGATWSEAQLMSDQGGDWPRLAVAGGLLHLVYGNTVGDQIWVRTRPVEKTAEPVWTPGNLLNDWQGVAFPFAVVATGSQETSLLHLIGASKVQGLLFYSFWSPTNDSTQAWSPVEAYTSAGQASAGVGVWASAPPQGSSLAVIWKALQPSFGVNPPQVNFLTVRSIPLSQIDSAGTERATPTPTPTPTPEPQDLEPTHTPVPDLNQVPPPSDQDISPMFLGIGVSILIVGLVLTGWYLTKRR